MVQNMDDTSIRVKTITTAKMTRNNTMIFLVAGQNITCWYKWSGVIHVQGGKMLPHECMEPAKLVINSRYSKSKNKGCATLHVFLDEIPTGIVIIHTMCSTQKRKQIF